MSGPHQDLDPASPGHRFYDVSAISLNQALGTHVHAHTHTHTRVLVPQTMALYVLASSLMLYVAYLRAHTPR